MAVDHAGGETGAVEIDGPGHDAGEGRFVGLDAGQLVDGVLAVDEVDVQVGVAIRAAETERGVVRAEPPQEPATATVRAPDTRLLPTVTGRLAVQLVACQ